MPPPKVLLVGWDAADWEVIHPLIESGGMQCLARVIEEGVMADMITLEPVLSPMLWNSIATGKRADQHGILGFTEVDPRNGHVRPVTSTSRKVKALWNILSQSGLRTNVIHWFGGHPAEPIRGVCVSDALSRAQPRRGQTYAPLMRGTVHPERLAPALEDLRIRPDEIDAELIQLFVPRASEIPAEKRGLLESLVRVQSECLTVHAAATYVMEHEPWDFMAVYYPSIDHFSHGFMDYHPPKLEWMDQELFDYYHDVMASGYRLHDLMLARLLQLAGDDVTLILLSDHGFHSDHLRPQHIPAIPCGPAVQHRPLGIFCMKGPGIRRDERIYCVNLLDVAPTVLSLFGLPAGSDMPGRVLVEAFEEPLALDRIPTWEDVPGECGMHAADFEMPPEDAHLLLEQFVALGYIEQPKENLEAARAECEQEQQWNLARVYMESWRFPEALPILEQLHDAVPERGDFALLLARCQQQLGLIEEAMGSVNAAIANHRETPQATWCWARSSTTPKLPPKPRTSQESGRGRPAYARPEHPDRPDLSQDASLERRAARLRASAGDRSPQPRRLSGPRVLISAPAALARSSRACSTLCRLPARCAFIAPGARHCVEQARAHGNAPSRRLKQHSRSIRRSVRRIAGWPCC
jgi:predicted AlkP superfamily phosphohydrolase/phosphomutase